MYSILLKVCTTLIYLLGSYLNILNNVKTLQIQLK